MHEACTQRQHEITSADLPLSCPLRDEQVWNAHPKVYLPLEESGTVVCPYCGTKYILKDFTPEDSN
jgi:uncharacterized Zn-finger protein